MDVPCHQPTKPRKPFECALFDFMSMGKGRSQTLIVRYFVEQLVRRSELCEQGSILIFNPERGVLKLYEELKANNLSSIADFPSADFDINEGLAGLAFRKRSPEYAPNTAAHPEFQPVPGQDIASIYCVPILLDYYPEPFGVVSFHNGVAVGQISEEKRRQMHVAVKALEAMLSVAPLSRRLVPNYKVFIVHGRNEGVRAELEVLLRRAGVGFVVIQSLARTGQDLLTFIENSIQHCVAGFVLLTPDDEGRFYKFGEPLRLRARQNVVFESGYLTALFRGANRVCFLMQGDLEIPSDLNGLLMERFDERLDEKRILKTLEQWGLLRDRAPDGEAKAAGRDVTEGSSDDKEEYTDGEADDGVLPAPLAELDFCGQQRPPTP